MTNVTLDIDLPRSIDNTVSLSYNLDDYANYTLPDWVELDTNSSQIMISAPSVTSDTMYQFSIRINSSADNETYYKPIYLIINY